MIRTHLPPLLPSWSPAATQSPPGRRWTRSFAAALALHVSTARADDGPAVEVPLEPSSPIASVVRVPGPGGAAGTSNTVVGGYGELHLGVLMPEGEGENVAEIDLHRLVLFIGHRFDEQLSTLAEIEVEHAFAKTGAPGEVAIEQAFVDYAFLGDDLSLRAGVMLVPMGIINVWHEPPVFHGVERPAVESVIIPSTWREGGLSLRGAPAPWFRFELAVLSGLNPLGFSGGSGIRGGRQRVAEAVTNGPAVAARVEVEPTLGVVVGASGYHSNAGPNVLGHDLRVPVTGVAVDARAVRAGFEARAVMAWFGIGGTEKLRALTDESGAPAGADVGSSLFGVYGEVAYDVLRPADTEQQLLPFVRVERYDTAQTKDAESLVGERAVTDLVLGVSYRPIRQVVFKSNFTMRSPDEGDGTNQWDLGVGWMF